MRLASLDEGASALVDSDAMPVLAEQLKLAEVSWRAG